MFYYLKLLFNKSKESTTKRYHQSMVYGTSSRKPLNQDTYVFELPISRRGLLLFLGY